MVKFHSMGWKNVALTFREKLNPQQNDEDFRFEVQDDSRLYVACWGISLLETEETVFIDWPPESRKSSKGRILI